MCSACATSHQAPGTDGAGVHRLRLRWRRHESVCRGRAACAAVGIRPDQGGRGVGRPDAPAVRFVDRAHCLAVWRPWSELRQDHGAVGRRARHGVGGRRPKWAADLDCGPGRRDRATGRGRSAVWDLSRHVRGGDDVVRLHPGDLPLARTRPSAGAVDDVGRFCATGAAAFYSVLGHDAWETAGVAPIREWREALALAVADFAGVPA